jgi:hypothetical protein
VTSYTNAGQRNGYGYQLDTRAEWGGGVQSTYYKTLDELAWATYQAMCAREHVYATQNPMTPWRDRKERAMLWLIQTARACSLRGKSLDIGTLCDMGPSCNPRRFLRNRWSSQGYVRRQGPVPGTSKWRGGPSYRNERVMAMRRQNMGWLPEEGEVECRARHRDRYTYISMDGRARAVQRCWKSQHKGRKAWDRD